MHIWNHQGLMAAAKPPSTGQLSGGTLKDDRIAEEHLVEGGMLPLFLLENLTLLSVRFLSYSRKWCLFTLLVLVYHSLRVLMLDRVS